MLKDFRFSVCDGFAPIPLERPLGALAAGACLRSGDESWNWGRAHALEGMSMTVCSEPIPPTGGMSTEYGTS